MAGGFVLQWRGMAWFGALWRGLGRGELKSGRKGAEGAKKTRAAVGFCGRILGLLWVRGCCAFGTIFAHQKGEMWGFVGKNGVRFFNFSLERGCAKRVLDVCRGIAEGACDRSEVGGGNVVHVLR